MDSFNKSSSYVNKYRITRQLQLATVSQSDHQKWKTKSDGSITDQLTHS